jgi:hypothetical protein
MLHCYSALNSEGPVSAHHVRELLVHSAEKGAVWPAPVYALLDDVINRGGRLELY